MPAENKGDALRTLGAIGIFAVCLLALGFGPLLLGPSEWDDAMYCDRAAVPDMMWEIRNRYVHVWSLRIFNMLTDTRLHAAVLYSTSVVIAIGSVGLLLAKRAAGFGAGALAMGLVALHPALLKYLTVPFVDPTMTLWSMTAVLGAVIALQAQSPRLQAAGAALAGAAAFLAAESKETGLAALGAVVVVLAVSDRRARLLPPLAGGVLAGWLMLSGLDALFAPGDSWWSANPANYFAKDPDNVGRGGSGTRRFKENFIGQLMTTGFIPFTLAGVFGAVTGFRSSSAVRVVSVWLVAALFFSSAAAGWYGGIYAAERYTAAIAAGFAVTGAYWLATVWRSHDGAVDAPRWVLAFGGLMVAVPIGALLHQQVVIAPESRMASVAYYTLPFGLTALMLTPWLTRSRVLTRGALALAFGAAAIASGRAAVDHVREGRQRMAPWVEVADALEQSNANLARYKAAGEYPRWRLNRRLRVLLRRPAAGFEAREVKKISDIADDEWVFTSPKRGDELAAKGYERFVQVDKDSERKSWAVYRRVQQR